jgi:hypothetical protein
MKLLFFLFPLYLSAQVVPEVQIEPIEGVDSMYTMPSYSYTDTYVYSNGWIPVDKEVAEALQLEPFQAVEDWQFWCIVGAEYLLNYQKKNKQKLGNQTKD